MKSLGPTVLCVLATGCSTRPDRAELASDVHATQGLRVRVRDVDGRVPGIDPEELRRAFVERLGEIGLPASGPARAELAVSIVPSGRTIPPPDVDDGKGNRAAAPRPPARWFWIRVRLSDAADGRALYEGESELRESNSLRPRDLASRMLRPLEE